jgi:hypothetical protein
MIINKNNIKSLLDITTNDYDNKIDLLLLCYINQIVKYCNNHFVVQKQSGRIQVLNNVITFDRTINLPFENGGFVVLGLSDYNKENYQIDSFTENTININDKYKIYPDSFSGYLGLVIFPSQIISILADYLSIVINENQNIESEKLGDHQVKYSNVNTDDFIKFSAGKLQHYRNIFSDEWTGKQYGY